MSEAVAFIDLAAQRARLGSSIEAAIGRVLAHGKFIMGPEIAELERKLAAYCDARHAVSCASGTDALLLALLALDLRPGDVVAVPTFTFAATAEAVALLGGVPLYVDVLPDTFNIDPASLKAALDTSPVGRRPVGIITVDLFGQPCDYNAIEPLAAQTGAWLVVDAAQSFGATFDDRVSGSIGRVTTTSFFPAKPLGCYGDGGAVFTDDDELAARMRSLRVHGQGDDKYDNVRIGMNGRLDTIQAAILLEKLRIFDDELQARQRVAKVYDDALAGCVEVPVVIDRATSAWAQYTVRAAARGQLVADLRSDGIPTAVYYPKALHQQSAYRDFPIAPGGLHVAEMLAGEVVSLPMHPYLDAATQSRICDAICKSSERSDG